MQAKLKVDAGICGFQTTAQVTGDDDQQVVFDVQSDCQKIRSLGELLKARGAIDAFSQMGPVENGTIMQTARSMSKGCCAGCIVPLALFRGMQVAAGLALPKDVHIGLAKE